MKTFVEMPSAHTKKKKKIMNKRGKYLNGSTPLSSCKSLLHSVLNYRLKRKINSKMFRVFVVKLVLKINYAFIFCLKLFKNQFLIRDYKFICGLKRSPNKFESLFKVHLRFTLNL